jgi:CBS domain-containing protein
MTSAVITAQPQQTVREVAALMRRHDVGSVVLERGGRPVGFITDRDLTISVLADGRAHEDAVADHASSPVITASVDSEVDECAQLMIRHGVRRLVLVDGGLIAGVVTLDGLAQRSRGRDDVFTRLSAQITRAATPILN